MSRRLADHFPGHADHLPTTCRLVEGAESLAWCGVWGGKSASRYLLAQTYIQIKNISQ